MTRRQIRRVALVFAAYLAIAVWIGTLLFLYSCMEPARQAAVEAAQAAQLEPLADDPWPDVSQYGRSDHLAEGPGDE